MATEYYNYGLAKDVASKIRDGMYSGGYQYTTDIYHLADRAGAHLGVDPKNIEVVLKFEDDGKFKKGPNVAQTPSRGFIGGATQFEHPGRPKPVAQRKIFDRQWVAI